MSECQTYTLGNGLRIIRMPSLSPVVYCGFAIDAGTRDEDDGEEGMAHFVEHLIFKGTEKRKAWHILLWGSSLRRFLHMRGATG